MLNSHVGGNAGTLALSQNNYQVEGCACCGGSELPGSRNTNVAKGVKHFHKWLEACVSANGGYFEHKIWSLT